MFNRMRLMFLNTCVWFAAKLTKLASRIFSFTVGLAMKWDIQSGGKSTADVAAPTSGKAEKSNSIFAPPPPATPVVETAQEAPVGFEKPSVRHRRLRKERAAAKAQAATQEPAKAEGVASVPTEEPDKPLAKEKKVPLPDVNPFSMGGVEGPIPMCMDSLPNFVVFEAMFNKKYGKNGRCPLNVGGNAHAYSALELFTLMSKIEADGEKAGPVYNALYGTIMSVVVNQFGKKLKPLEIN